MRELTESLAAVQQNVSQHLAIMHKAGVLERKKAGTRVFYELGDSYSVAIVESARAALAQRSQQLAQLSAALAKDGLATPGADP